MPRQRPVADTFLNPVAEGADPFVVRDGDRYLCCQSEGNVAVAVWVSDRLPTLGTRHVVWRAPAKGACSAQVWAPELRRLDDRWYIYLAASDGHNATHRTYVLAAQTDDPLGRYDLHGPLSTGDDPGGPDLWSIDMTVLEHAGRKYALWSGWPDAQDDLQHLYAAELATPTRIGSPRVRIATAGEFDWQRTAETPTSRGLLEAPQVLSRGDGDRTFVTYSCSASWLPTYKVGLLELVGDDPLDPGSWNRMPHPVFTSSAETVGVGHGSFVSTPDRREWWHVYHAKVDARDGWRRAIFVQPLTWREDGTPDFGTPVPRRQPVALPAATPRQRVADARSWRFDGSDGSDDETTAGRVADFDYYGHHQFLRVADDGVHLGETPPHPVNAYRCGEKLVLRDGDYADVHVTTLLSFADGERAAGVLFRVSAVCLGYDAQQAYFAGLVPREGRLVLGATDGDAYTMLAAERFPVAAGASYRLEIHAVGSRLEATVTTEAPHGPATGFGRSPTGAAGAGARVEAVDTSYADGSVGLRVVDTHARFSELTVRPLG